MALKALLSLRIMSFSSLHATCGSYTVVVICLFSGPLSLDAAKSTRILSLYTIRSTRHQIFSFESLCAHWVMVMTGKY